MSAWGMRNKSRNLKFDATFEHSDRVSMNDCFFLDGKNLCELMTPHLCPTLCVWPIFTGEIYISFFQKLTSGPWDLFGACLDLIWGPPEPGPGICRLRLRQLRWTNSQFPTRPPSHLAQEENTSLRNPRCDHGKTLPLTCDYSFSVHKIM